MTALLVLAGLALLALGVLAWAFCAALLTLRRGWQ